MAEVKNNVDESRYEIFVEGQRVGLMTYHVDGATVAAPHTEIEPTHGGQGLGAELVEAALDDIRDKGMKVRPLCPFVSHFIARHPSYQDLLEGS